MMKKLAAALLAAVIVASSAVSLPSTGEAATNTIVQDDFSADSNLWTYLGSAALAPDNTMLLTPSEQSQVGTIWLKQTIAPPFTVSFKFKMSDMDPWGEGADGIVFMFNKLQNIAPVSGGGMGFEVGNGYGVEFDSYVNQDKGDPDYNHISFFKDTPEHALSTPLKQVRDDTFEDSQWHDVKVDVGTGSVAVYVDGQSKFFWSGELDNAYNGIGFTASTGYYYNAQYIDGVVITKSATVSGVSSTLADGAYKAGTVIPIQVTFNDAIYVTGTPALALNTVHSAVYSSGSGTSTLTFNYTVQPGDNVNELNYISESALSGGTIKDSEGNIIAVSLPAVDAANSLAGSSKLKLDTTGPTGTAAVLAGDPATATAVLALSASDGAAGTGVARMRFSSDNATWSGWESYVTSKSYALPSATVTQSVYVQFADTLENVGPTASVTIHPPIASSGSLLAGADSPATGVLPASSPDGRAIKQYTIVSAPSKGTISLNETNGTYTYTPNAGSNGMDSFTYRVSDGVMDSDTATITIFIGGFIPYIPSLIVDGGTLNASFDPQQSAYTLNTMPSTTGASLIASLLPGPYKLTVSGATYSVSLADPVSAAGTNPDTAVTAAVYRVQVQLGDATAFQLHVVNADTADVLATYTFNIVRELPWLQSAVTEDTDSVITLIGRTPLRLDEGLRPDSFRLEGGPIVVAAAYDAADTQHRTVKLSLASPLAAGSSPTLSFDRALVAEDGHAISASGYPIFGKTQKTVAKQTVDSAHDGVRMDDVIGYLSGASGGDLNGDGSFDFYDVQLLLSLIDSRFIAR